MQPNATLVFQAILSQLDKVEHMDAFVRHLPSAAL